MTGLTEIWDELREKGYHIARCNYLEFSSEEVDVCDSGKVSLKLCGSIDDVFRKHAETGQICLTPERIKLILYDFPTHIHPNNTTEKILPENYFIELDIPQRHFRITEPPEKLKRRLTFYTYIAEVFKKYGWSISSILG